MSNGNETYKKVPVKVPVREIVIVTAAFLLFAGVGIVLSNLSNIGLSSQVASDAVKAVIPASGPVIPSVVPSEKVGTIVEENKDFRVEVVKEAFIKPHPTPGLMPVVTNVKFVKIREGKVSGVPFYDIRVTFSESDALGLREGFFYPRVLGTDHLYEDFYNPHEVLHHHPMTIGGKQAEFRLVKGSAETYFVAIIEGRSAGDFNSFYSYSPTYKVSLIS